MIKERASSTGTRASRMPRESTTVALMVAEPRTWISDSIGSTKRLRPPTLGILTSPDDRSCGSLTCNATVAVYVVRDCETLKIDEAVVTVKITSTSHRRRAMTV